MKNKVILLLTFAVAIFFSSCEKDKSLTEAKTIKIDPTEQKILDFKEKMKNPKKSDETMSIEDAVWNIEAALNYTYCIVPKDKIGDGLAFDTETSNLEFNVNVSNNTISLVDAINSYNQMKDEIAVLLAEIKSEVKFIYLIDVEFEEGKFIVRYTAKYSDGANKYLWDISDDWYPCHTNPNTNPPVYAGNCSGTDMTSDLLKEIEQWISRNRAVYSGVYYTNHSSEGIFYSYSPSEADMLPNCQICTNIYGAPGPIVEMYTSLNPIWQDGSPLWEQYANIECVVASRGNYYAAETNKGLDKIQDYHIASNRHVVSCKLEGQYQVYRYHEVGPDEWWLKHRMRVWSAIPHKYGQDRN